MLGFMARVGVATAAVVAVSAAPAAAATKQCGTVRGVGNQTSATKVTTTSGTCLQAKTVAKGFARSRSAPRGFTCRERFTTPLKRANVTCRRTGRIITFTVTWNGSFPLPAAPALPSVGGS